MAVRDAVLQPAYSTLFRWLGKPQIVSRNKYLRFAFLKLLFLSRRLFGVPTTPRRRRLRSGIEILCHLEDHLQAELYYLGDYAASEIQALVDRLQPGDVVVDAGGHCGLFSIEMAKAVTEQGHVYSFEPGADLAAQHRANAAANGVDERLEVLEIALGATSDDMDLVAPSGAAGDAGRRSLFVTGDKIATVPIRRLDDLVQEGVVTIDRSLGAVKIDVEGGELEALKGMERTLAEYPPRVVLVEALEETLNRAGTSVRELVSFMEARGFTRVSRGETAVSKFNALFVPSDALLDR